MQPAALGWAGTDRFFQMLTRLDTSLRPPDDRLFQDLLHRAVRGEIPVYGVVLDIQEVEIKRRHEDFRPENSEVGEKIVRSMWEAWQNDQCPQPWLYVWDGEYTIADDYFWLALVERGTPRTVAAQVLGEPLAVGLIERVGPLSIGTIEKMLGIARKQ